MNVKRLIAGNVLLACMLGLLWYLAHLDAVPEPSSSRAIDASFAVPAGTPYEGMPASPGQPSYAKLTESLANPLERAQDLRSLYELYKSSNDPVERNIAYRAWSACFPAFIAPQGESPTLESVTRALPRNASNNAERIEAYRSLLGRCKNFFEIPRDKLLAETRQLNNEALAGQADTPGERALRTLADGNTSEAAEAARAVVASQDAFAIRSLQDFMYKYLSSRTDALPEQPAARPDLRALAFSLAACELGMECGAGSLKALQLCANLGQCSGSVQERYLQSLSNQAERDIAQKERDLVVGAVRNGDYRALGL
ncbi:MAG: hypothetical protein V4488_02955 [Pseudomonadota bacterium]